MYDVSLEWLLSLLAGALLISAFFSASETGMMSLNRYRLKHLANKGNRHAIRTTELLKHPEQLRYLTLIGHHLANNLAVVFALLIALRLCGENVWLAILPITLGTLFLTQITPRALAVTQPERIAFASSWALHILAYVFLPLVRAAEWLSDVLQRLGKTTPGRHDPEDQLSPKDLRTFVNESGNLLPDQRQGMLLTLLELEKSTVEDIMIPRNEVEGLDLELPVTDLLQRISTSEYTRLPVYTGDINQVVGILHLRNAARFIRGNETDITHEDIRHCMSEPYFVPESTPLHTQLLNFRQQKSRIALVVDEYGDVQGLVTLTDLLEEIVGDFTTNSAEENATGILAKENGWYLIDGGTFVRDINRSLNWDLPLDGPKTLNGLAMEYLENIPDAAVGFELGNYHYETTQVTDKMIAWLRVSRIHEKPNSDE